MKQDKPLQYWFQESNGQLVLFIVFYTKKCRWGRCMGCSLPAMMSDEEIPSKHLKRQIDYVFLNPEVKKNHKKINKVIISNNGSIFDEDTFPHDALKYLTGKMRKYLSNIKTLSLETRAEYVDPDELWFLFTATENLCEVEVAIGFEAFDDRIRNKYLKKGLSLKNFTTVVKMISLFGFKLKCYFRLKPTAKVSSEEAIEDVHKGIDLLDYMANRYGVKVNMHLNPTYVARGTSLEDDFNKGKFTPPTYQDLVKSALHAKNKKVNIYLGIDDEGLAVENGTFLDKESEVMSYLKLFNKTRDFDILERIQ